MKELKVEHVPTKREKITRTIAAAAIIGAAAGAITVGAWIIRNASLRPVEREATVELSKVVYHAENAALADLPAHGVGRADKLVSYTEGDGPAPAWFKPGDPMAAEWTADFQQDLTTFQQDSYDAQSTCVIDAGCPDWNLDSTLTGWDGHRAERWELELLARIFYREFWGTSDTLCEAGIDAILRLWESEYYSPTLGGTLSAQNPDGSWAYSTYPFVWCDDYDADGLAWCREYTETRFYEGPTWIAEYFRKGHYHDWGEWTPTPVYEIDGIYFSTSSRLG